MMSWDCWHYPGREYEVEEDNPDGSKTVRKVIATADVEDAHLAEISAVFKGATPGAVIIKALRDVDEGRMKPDVARFLEQRYRHLDLHLSRTRQVFPGNTSSEENRNMAQQNRDNETTAPAGGTGTGETAPAPATIDPPAADPAPPAEPPAAVDPPAVTPSAGDDPPPPAEEQEVEIASEDVQRSTPLVRSMLRMAGITEQGDLTASVRELLNAARDGMTYRTDLINAAHVEGVRAHGATAYKREQHDKIFRSADLDYIKMVTEEWARIAKEKFPGGRQTHDVGQDPDTHTPPPAAIPDSAYKVRSY